MGFDLTLDKPNKRARVVWGGELNDQNHGIKTFGAKTPEPGYKTNEFPRGNSLYR